MHIMNHKLQFMSYILFCRKRRPPKNLLLDDVYVEEMGDMSSKPKKRYCFLQFSSNLFRDKVLHVKCQIFQFILSDL